jgi:hypothetical protein
MAGLLDSIDFNDPQTAGLLNLGLGILAGNTGRPGDMGQGLMSGLQNYQQQMAQQQRQKMLDQQQQMQTTQFDWQKADREKADNLAADRQRVLGDLSQQYGIDPNVVTAFPGIGEDIVKNKLIPKAPKVAFTPSGVAYDEANPNLELGKTYAKPEADNTPSAVREYQFARDQGFNGSFVDFQLAQKRAGAANTNINMNQEKEEGKAVGKYFGEQYADIQKSGLAAGGKVNRVQRLNQLLEGVNTGKFAPLGVEVASAAQSLGFNIDPKLGNKQAAEALANEMALEMRNPAGGAGMPGALSDKDREFLKMMTPGIEKTPEGRRLISESMVKLANREREVARMAREYRKKRGTIDEGFYDELQSYSEKNQMFKTAPATNNVDSLVNKYRSK